MRTVAAIAMCVALGITHPRVAHTAEQPPVGSAARQGAASSGDEVHFVSVLKLRGQVVAVDHPNLLVTVKDSQGRYSTLQAQNETDLEGLKLGERVLVRYFEGAQVRAPNQKEVPAFSLKHGMMAGKLGGPSAKQHEFVARVKAVDPAEQEITLQADGSLETIVVANPEYLANIKVGDRVGLTRVQALALSLKKES